MYFGIMEMNIEIDQINGSVFKASNKNGSEQIIDGSAQKGLRPMESLLNAVASCAALDILHILKKQRQDLRNLKIDVSGVRPDTGEPKPFEKIRMNFILSGNLDKKKAERAVKLSVEKYCSVGASLKPDVDIEYAATIRS